jgi:hypothetical protein
MSRTGIIKRRGEIVLMWVVSQTSFIKRGPRLKQITQEVSPINSFTSAVTLRLHQPPFSFAGCGLGVTDCGDLKCSGSRLFPAGKQFILIVKKQEKNHEKRLRPMVTMTDFLLWLTRRIPTPANNTVGFI